MGWRLYFPDKNTNKIDFSMENLVYSKYFL